MSGEKISHLTKANGDMRLRIQRFYISVPLLPSDSFIDFIDSLVVLVKKVSCQ